jgi:hypothetical protein
MTMQRSVCPQAGVCHRDGSSRLLVLRRVVALACGLVLGGGIAARATEADEVWLISTRSVAACGAVNASDTPFDYWRLGADDQWQPADLESLLSTDDLDVPTTVFVHGNRADHDKAIHQAWPVYRCLKESSDGRRFRFVIWSWPADRIPGHNLPDLRVKAARSDVQALYLAWWVDQVRPNVPVSLIGYSFGARVITGALHILGGGEIDGHGLAQRKSPSRRPARAVLVAAAIDNDWLLPGHRAGLALDQVDQLLMTRNGSDRALRWYRMLDRRRGSCALGFTGPVHLAGFGPNEGKIQVVELTGVIGKVHDWTQYLNAPDLCAHLPAYAFLGNPVGENRPSTPILAGASQTTGQ